MNDKNVWLVLKDRLTWMKYVGPMYSICHVSRRYPMHIYVPVYLFDGGRDYEGVYSNNGNGNVEVDEKQEIGLCSKR